METETSEDMIVISKKELAHINEVIEIITKGKTLETTEEDNFDNDYLNGIYKNSVTLYKYIKELNSYSLAISHGDLDVDFPPRQNYLSAGLKELHSNLLHLTWKVNQISQGNYNQKIDFLGQISDSFNHMLLCLKERDEKIQELRTVIQIIHEYTNIIMYVVDAETGEIVYGRKSDEVDEDVDDSVTEFINELYTKSKTENKTHNEWDQFSPIHNKWFHVDSLFVNWTNDNKAYFHILFDISTQKRQIDNLELQISRDQMTGIYNHTFAVTTVKRLISQRCKFTICFMDLDGLKSANDIHGHQWGDKYLLKFIEVVNSSTRNSEYFCRLGGDEFLLILENVSNEDMIHIINRISDNIIAFNDSKEFPFPMSFSFGIETYDKNIHFDAQTMINMADDRMYVLKRGKYINLKRV